MKRRRKSPVSPSQMVMGVHPIKELLQHAPQRIEHVYTAKEKPDEIIQSCKEKKIPWSYAKKEKLTKMAETESHQMFLAKVKPRKLWSLEEFFPLCPEKCIVLLLDQIFDPQNLGALIRSAECLGAVGVIWSKNRGAKLSLSAVKASSGASEFLPLIQVSNLADTVQKFQKEGFEAVASLLDPKAENAFGFRFAKRTLLLLGSEGEGIQALLKKKAERKIFIPMSGKIGSINVSQAASSLLTLWGAWAREGKC